MHSQLQYADCISPDSCRHKLVGV